MISPFLALALAAAAPDKDMVLIPAGTFVMGDEKGRPDERPLRELSLDSFWMDKGEVSQARFESLMGFNPSKHGRKDAPVDQIRWLQAVKFCNQRSKAEGLKPCYDLKTGLCDFSASGYRLPTEAEWEYACRAGTQTPYFFGAEAGDLGRYAWFLKNAAGVSCPDGPRKANPWGLRGLLGGMLEWCQDIYATDAYSGGPAKNPRGPARGQERVLRGGSWKSAAEDCRSGARFHDQPANPDACFGWDTYGFRCVRAAGESH